MQTLHRPICLQGTQRLVPPLVVFWICVSFLTTQRPIAVLCFACALDRALCESVLLSCWDSVLLSCSNSESWPSRLRCRVFVATHRPSRSVRAARRPHPSQSQHTCRGSEGAAPEPVSTHTSSSHSSPEPQASLEPEQHGCSAWPQATHVSVAVSQSSAPVQGGIPVSGSQQARPLPPHAAKHGADLLFWSSFHQPRGGFYRAANVR